MQTLKKGQRERSQAERAQNRAERRALRRQAKLQRPASSGGEDPDLAGIVPGPQGPAEQNDR